VLDPQAPVEDDRPRVRGRAAIGTVLAALFALAVPAAASAATLNVTRFDDPVGGTCIPTDCSLRQAVALNPGAEPKTVVLKAGRYELTQNEPLRLDNNTETLTLNGAGARLTTIDGNRGSGVITVVEGSPVTINDATITGGLAGANNSSTLGGGINVEGASSLALNRSAVTGNQAPAQGGGIYADGDLTVVGSTISGNQAGLLEFLGQGAGIYVTFASDFEMTNSTLSGNVIDGGSSPNDGGAIFGAGPLVLTNVTIANNTSTGGAVAVSATGATVTNTIVASSTGPACSGSPDDITDDHSLDTDGSCGFGGQGTNPRLLALGNNGGPTDTHALASNSPAINAGTALACPSADQRGVARPQGGACDIGAYEYRSPHLTVIKKVVNDQGGTQAPADFSVHVRLNGADVSGSPKPGSAGTAYAIAPGTYVVGEDADSRYTAAFSGGCSASGAVVLTEGESKTCTITNNDKPPVVGQVINAVPAQGDVKVKFPGDKHFHRLREGEQLPNGTVVDTRNGRITLFAAANTSGGLAKADFFDGLFKVAQSKGKKPLTTLTLTEKLSCKGKGKASAAKKKKKKRRLWGDGKGKFRTKGSFSSATVRGTKWLVEDRCTSTLTRVARGKVAVKDFVKHKTVLVKAGKRYIAKKRG
jgi:predicted outer membrane repeat protein